MGYLALHCSYVLLHFKVLWLIFLVESITSLLGACNSHAKPMSRHFFPARWASSCLQECASVKKTVFQKTSVWNLLRACDWLSGSLNSLSIQFKLKIDCSVKKLWPEHGVRHYDSLGILKQWMFSCSCCLHLILLCLLLDVCVSFSYVRIVATITTFYPNFSSCHAKWKMLKIEYVKPLIQSLS